MSKEIKFDKYEQHGPYHWRQYVGNTKFRKHADRIKKMVKEKKVLDVGAGDGAITYMIGATGIDNEPKAVELANVMRVNVQHGDAYNIPFKDNEFEAVLMADVIEHLRDPLKALTEASRVAPVLYITTPPKGMVSDKYHVREWTPEEFPEYMRKRGWQIDGELEVIPEEKNMYARFTRIGDLPKTDQTLSILIPARNEEFLPETVEDLLKNIRGNTDIFVCLDGDIHPKPLPKDPRVTYVHRHESWGQRKATNQLCKLSQAKYVMKVDGHCAFDEGFDVKMMSDMQDDWTMVPVMRNLHAFNWVCDKCGHTTYQGPTPITSKGKDSFDACKKCENKEAGTFTKDIVWIPKENPQSTSYCFDTELHFQYFHDYKARQQGDLVETMSLQGSCFMLTREKYWELNICDEDFGSWGAQGTEVACKTWLSGGKCIVNKKTWYAHMFRTQGGDFSFPYNNPESKIAKARKRSQQLFLDNTWEQQTHPLSWLLERFKPVPYWHDGNDKGMLKKVQDQPLQ